QFAVEGNPGDGLDPLFDLADELQDVRRGSAGVGDDVAGVAVADFGPADLGLSHAALVDEGGGGLAGRVTEDADGGLEAERLGGLPPRAGLPHPPDERGRAVRVEGELDPENDGLIQVRGVVAEGEFVPAADLFGAGVGEDGDLADGGGDLAGPVADV